MDFMRMTKDFQRAATLQYEAGGVKGLTRLLLAILLKIFRGVYTQMGSGRRFCPCCGWKGANFLPYIEEGYVGFQTECPDCKSQARHRAHSLFYHKHFPSISGELLYVAPERNVEYFRNMASLKVRTSEYLPTASADFHYDLCDVDCPDSTWDYIVCHRVIEHVPDDRRAMRELHRILKPGGVCLLSVPIDLETPATVEFQEPNPLESSHYYRYGKDFVSRIPEGFAVQVHDFRNLFSAQEFESLQLCDDFVYVCTRNDPA